MRDDERLKAVLKDRYELVRRVGEGGMAVVFLARDIKHGRQVALKVLRPELSSAMGVDRFPREIQIVAQMQHPHILALHDSGEADGFHFYVMPFVDGETLRQRLARTGPLSIPEAVRLLTEIADALAYAHAHGVMHRDIKPDNVMLSGKHAVVTDFGVAKAVHASTRDQLTTVGIAVGTPQYMSPEQATADDTIDHRADLYSLGVLGYEMLTGRTLFEAATSQAILAAHVLEKPKDIRELRPEVPPLLASALLKCLEKNPRDRWQSAQDLLSQLELVITTPSGGITPTNTRPLHALRSGPMRKSWRVASVALVMIAVASAFGVYRAQSVDGIQRIGVLPIDDISGKDSVFVTAMHDGLTGALSRLRLAGVAPRREMLRYANSGKTTREIARASGLQGVIEATVFRAGDVMRINVQFTDPVTSRSYWAETYERDVRDVLKAQDEVVQKVASGVRGSLISLK